MTPNTEIRPVVFILSSTAATREALQAVLRGSAWGIETYRTAREFLRGPHDLVPSCLLLDAVLADMCGLELQKHLSGTRPDLVLVFVAVGADVAVGVRAMKSGAVDFLSMPLDANEVLQAVDEAIKRSSTALSREAELRVLAANYARLSSRQRDVMALVTSGLLNKQVGDRLGISEITVKAHRGQVMRKMNAGSFADLVNQAAKLNLELPRAPRLRPFGSDTVWGLQGIYSRPSSAAWVQDLRGDIERDGFTRIDGPQDAIRHLQGDLQRAPFS